MPANTMLDIWSCVDSFYNQFGEYFKRPDQRKSIWFALQELGEVSDALSRMPNNDDGFNRANMRQTDFRKEVAQLIMMCCASILPGTSALSVNVVVEPYTTHDIDQISLLMGKVSRYIGAALTDGYYNPSDFVEAGSFYMLFALRNAWRMIPDPEDAVADVLDEIYKKRVCPHLSATWICPSCQTVVEDGCCDCTLRSILGDH